MDRKVTPFAMLIIALIILTLIFIYLNIQEGSVSEQSFWFVRVLTAISASAISISIPGTITIGKESNQDEMQTMAQKAPNITASGAIAVFVLVYLFNPISL